MPKLYQPIEGQMFAKLKELTSDLEREGTMVFLLTVDASNYTHVSCNGNKRFVLKTLEDYIERLRMQVEAH